MTAFGSAQRILADYHLQAYDPMLEKQKAHMGEVQNGIEFLGCEIYPGLINPGRDCKKRFIESLTTIVETSKQLMSSPLKLVDQGYSIVETLSDISNIVKGWGNQYSFCNNRLVMKRLDEQITKLVESYLQEYRRAMQVLGRDDYVTNWRRVLGVHLLLDSKYDPIIQNN